MFDLNIHDLISTTAETESIHIWRPPKVSSAKSKASSCGCCEPEPDQTIKSEETFDVDKAMKAVKKGCSLYFTSSPEFRNTYGKQLSYQMGYDFASYFPGSTTKESAGDSITEIEIFVSKKGNYTDWHLDFQENFTY